MSIEYNFSGLNVKRTIFIVANIKRLPDFNKNIPIFFSKIFFLINFCFDFSLRMHLIKKYTYLLKINSCIMN